MDAHFTLGMEVGIVVKYCLILLLVLFLLGVFFIAGGTIGHSFILRGLRFLRRLSLWIMRHVPVNGDVIYPIMDRHQISSIADAMRLTYIGDLILLREMVDRAKLSDGRYDFTPMFAHVKDRFEGSDYVLGVLEGPLAGNRYPYSTSNYGDGIPLRNNFPDSYATAIKDAGIDFVTTATNHLMDCGIAGVVRTLDELDRQGIEHAGTYRNKEERAGVELVEVSGHKVAILAYTYGSEYCKTDFFFTGDGVSLTRVLVDKRSPYYSACRKAVLADFKKVRALNPELIIVMPHMGDEFLHATNKMQRFWVDFFVKEGADLILADHPHAVEPIEWMRNSKGDWSLVVYCPGNFINSYTHNDGDASMLVDIYLDKNSMKPIAAGVTPVFAYGRENENYVAWPVGDFLFQVAQAPDRNSIGDVKRCKEVNEIVTKSALGVSLPFHNLQDRYFTFPNTGYMRQRVAPLGIELYKDSAMIRAIAEANCICFVGDSITEGTKNGGYGWYEPIAEGFPQKKFSLFAKGGETSVWVKDNASAIAAIDADLYVIAIGCNDIRYRNPTICAMTPEEYIDNLSVLVEKLRDAKFVFIVPWYSRTFDPYCKIPLSEKRAVYDEYAKALKEYSEKIGALFVDPNPVLDIENKHRNVLVDHIHPDASEGIRAYAAACLMAS